MKQVITFFTAVLISSMSYAQFEVSLSSGYALGSATMKLGETVSSSEIENNYGSFGEGANFQLRGTYFFNETFGVDLGVGYLLGTDQTISEVDLPGYQVDAIARARAYGASASLVYKFTNNVYGRFGALIKIAGKTEGIVSQTVTFSDQEAAALGLPSGSYSQTNYKEDFHGKFPLGFVGALGYKYALNDNFSLFLEAEYYGISLKRKDSEITEFNTDIVLPDGTVAVAGFYNIDKLPDGYNLETTYVDEISTSNDDSTQQLSEKVPYSSFGLNFGVTYKFKSASKSKTIPTDL